MKFLTIIALLLGANFAHAESMSCMVGVYTAADVQDENVDPTKNTIVATLNLVNGAADQEFTVNGEKVALTVRKFQFADLYNFTAVLLTPVADLPPKGPNFVSIIADHIYNDGPTKENGWDINPSLTAERFAYLTRKSGTFALATKTVAALKQAGKWGAYPFNSTQLDITQSIEVADFVREQLLAKTMQPTDVIGMSTLFSCTHEK